MEIAPNIHWLKLSSVNAYLCIDDDNLVLIDTGMPKSGKTILQYIHKLGFQPQALHHILLTHADIDHAGSVAFLVQETGATVYTSTSTANYLRQGISPPHMPRLVQFILNRFIKFEPLTTTRKIQDEDILPLLNEIQVLDTPGHTLDHVSFYHPQSQVLFAGDALNTRGNKLQVTPNPITADKIVAAKSAQRLLQLSPKVFACGHGSPMQNFTEKDIHSLLESIKKLFLKQS